MPLWAYPRPQRKRHLDQFSRFCTAHGRMSVHYTLQWAAPFLPQNCPFSRGMWTPSNTWFPRPTRVLNLNSILIGSTNSVGLTTLTDRLTDSDRPCYAVCTIGRIYVHSTAMWPNNNKWSTVKVMTRRLHHWRTWMVQLYSPDYANVHLHLIHASLDPPESASQMTSRSVQWYLQDS